MNEAKWRRTEDESRLKTKKKRVKINILDILQNLASMNYKSKQVIQQEREGMSFLYVQVEK